VLSRRDIAAFERDGVVVLRDAVPRRVAAACRSSIRHRLLARGIDPADPATWTEPVVQVPWPATAGFASAAGAPALTEAYDQLIGRGAWNQVPVVGGTVLVRFPHRRSGRDTTWHVDGSFARDGRFVTTMESPTRGFLCLILLSDVGPSDAPTELKVGSHRDVAPILAPFGAAGCGFLQVTASLPPSTFERPSMFATGRAGDVYLCHPFLVHRATGPHRGERPRVLAQPGMMLHRPFRLEGGRPRAVERALRAAVRAAEPPPATARRAAKKASTTGSSKAGAAGRTKAKEAPTTGPAKAGTASRTQATTARKTTARKTAARRTTTPRKAAAAKKPSPRAR
jgi:hypothetical protein